MTNKNHTDTLNHACYVALGAESGDFDVAPGTDAHRVLHNAAALVLRLHQEDRNALVNALQSVAVTVPSSGLRAGDFSQVFGGQAPTPEKAGLSAKTIKALMGMLDDAHARHNRLLAAAKGGVNVLQGIALVEALEGVSARYGQQVPGGAFLNFMAHEGVPAWLVESVRPNGVHAVHGFEFGDIGNLWTNAVKGMPVQAWCRAMGTGAVADLAVHAQALYLLLETADAEYALGVQHLRLGVFGQPAQVLQKAPDQWLASAKAMVAGSAAVRQGNWEQAPWHAVERLAVTLGWGYTLATGTAPSLQVPGAAELLYQWEDEVMHWWRVVHTRGAGLNSKARPSVMTERGALKARESLNQLWAEKQGVTSNDK